jgi:hypothetical protein
MGSEPRKSSPLLGIGPILITLDIGKSLNKAEVSNR